MLPISLTIKGINSYQQQTTIKFEPLMQAGLFGVFGKVGGGKSTLIDAICLALYDKNEKLNSKDKRNYNLMNLQSNELLIDFEFAAGKNLDDKYRFVIQGKREKKFEEVKSFTKNTYQWTNNEWLPNEALDAEKILDLSYENFKRTIIIPQGQFKEFLELRDTDRTDMLKQIFNLHRFEFYNQAAQLEAIAKTENNQLIGKLQQLQDFTPQLLENETNNYIEIENKLKKANQNLQELTQKWATLNQLKADAQQLNDLKISQRELAEKNVEIKNLEEKLNDYLLCFRIFKPLLEQENKTKLIRHALEQEAANFEIDANKKNISLSNLTLKNKEILKEKNSKEDLQTQLQNWNCLKNIAEIEQENLQNSQQLNSLTHLFVQLQNTEKEIEKNIETLEKQTLNLQQNTPDSALINELDRWFVQQENLEKRTKEQQQFIEKMEQEIAQGAKEKQQLIEQATALDIALKEQLNLAKISACSDILQTHKNQIITPKLQALELQKQNLTEKRGLYQYSKALKAGDPCPLCGAQQHPNPLSAHNPTQEIEAINQQIDQLKQQNTAIDALNSSILNLIQNFKQKQNYLKEWEQKLNESKQEIAILYAQKPPLNLTFDELKAQKAHILQTTTQKEKLEKELTQARNELRKGQLDLKTAQQQTQELKTKNDVAKGKIATYQLQLKAPFTHNETEKITVQEASLKIGILEKNLQAIAENETQINQLEQEIANIKIHLQISQERLTEAVKIHEKNFHELMQAVDNSGFENLSIIDTLLAQNLDTETLKERIENHKIKAKINDTQINSLETKLKNAAFNLHDFEALAQQKKLLEKETEQLNQQLGATKISIQGIEKNLSEKTGIEQKNKALETRLIDLKTLKSLFYTSGFVNYISSIYLKELCHAANQRFMPLTHNQMSIEIDEANHFVVRDHLNGGKLRLAKTLSGGQKFQASLSLALALSERVSKRQYQPKHFFFIDEGFGSLDPDSLQQVYETLQNLSKENKIVGVISHMEALQENIQNYLYIENHEKNGSSIRINT